VQCSKWIVAISYKKMTTHLSNPPSQQQHTRKTAACKQDGGVVDGAAGSAPTGQIMQR